MIGWASPAVVRAQVGGKVGIGNLEKMLDTGSEHEFGQLQPLPHMPEMAGAHLSSLIVIVIVIVAPPAPPQTITKTMYLARDVVCTANIL